MIRKVWRRIIPFGLSATVDLKGGRRNIPFGLSVISKEFLSSKDWRRIIPFGLSVTSAMKGRRRNIPVGLSVDCQKLQHKIYLAEAKKEKVI